MLEVINVTKRFGGLVANSEISFTLKEGEIMGIIGPNGSGKTTMFNMITGFLNPTEGDIRFCGDSIVKYKPYEILGLGIARTFQITNILPNITVEDNLLYALFSQIDLNMAQCILRGRKFRSEEAKAKERINEVLELLQLTEIRTELASKIPPAVQRRLMIANALVSNPKLILLDEPAAGTSADEQLELVEMLRKIRDTGVSILIIEHNMRLVMNLCEHIVAFDFGKKIGDGTPDEIRKNQAVIDAYLGEADDAKD